jgi:hypothetical protein
MEMERRVSRWECQTREDDVVMRGRDHASQNKTREKRGGDGVRDRKEGKGMKYWYPGHERS